MRNLQFCALILVLSAGAALADPKPAATTSADQEKATIDKICTHTPTQADRDAQYVTIISKSLLLSDDQKKTLKDYQDTLAKSIAAARSQLCDNKPDLSSFEAGLAFREKMLEEQLATVKAVNPKLVAFYDGLNAEQKAKFDQMRETMVSPGAAGKK